MKKWNYSDAGWYFVTICTKNKEESFGKVQKEKVVLNVYGEKIKNIWENIPQHFENVVLDEFIVMPNHVHGIVIIESEKKDKIYTVGNNDRCSLQRNMELLPKVISQCKSSFTREIRKKYGDFSFAWQKSFYDHIIRNERSLLKIREYIHYNALKWEKDKENPKNLVF
ncbi:transposase [Candidatus Gracilibacteria bacterium]|nr:transposase [Candidatus Gracilibacteria bacterium]MCF7819392.1 transposase [Candidatus Gracilibacteria bacterium]